MKYNEIADDVNEFYVKVSTLIRMDGSPLSDDHGDLFHNIQKKQQN